MEWAGFGECRNGAPCLYFHLDPLILVTNKICFYIPRMSGVCEFVYLCYPWEMFTNACLGCEGNFYFLISELQEKVKLDAEREKLERLQELYSEQKTQLDNCPESMREQLQQQLKRVSSKQECASCFFVFFNEVPLTFASLLHIA